MKLSKRLLGAVVGSILLAGALAPAVSAETVSEPDESLPEAAVVADATEVEPLEEHLAVFSADVRVDGYPIEEEWYLALGYDDQFPFLAALWLLVDAETDEWAPLCLGYLFGGEDDEGAIFIGGSTLGGEDDGCMLVGLGDDSGIVFGAVELEGESVLTAAMYAIGEG